MKTVTGLLFTLCVARAVSQMSTFDCVLSAVQTFGTPSNLACATLLSENIPGDGSSRSSFCGSDCATEVNNYFMASCNLSYSELVCTKETENSANYCVTDDNIDSIVTTLSDIAGGPCLQQNCSNSSCANAVQDLTCCVDTLTRFGANVQGYAFGNFLPSDCGLPQCPPATFGESETESPGTGTTGNPGTGTPGNFGGAPSLMAMPTVIATAMLAAVVASL